MNTLLPYYLIVVFFVFTNTAQAARTCAVPGDWYNIQAALDDDSCSEIEVGAGTWQHTLTVDRDVVIRGAVDDDDNLLTIIDGNSGGTVVNIVGERRVLLEQFVLQNGYASADGGCVHKVGGELSINHVMIRNCHSQNNGGGIHNFGDVFLTRVTLTDNSTGSNSRGGSIYHEDGQFVANDIAVFDSRARMGAGIYLKDSEAEIHTASFEGNSNNAIFLRDTHMELSFADVRQNISTSVAGGISSHIGSTFSIRDSSFVGNMSRGGGAIHIVNMPSNAIAQIERTAFIDNHAFHEAINTVGNGGAIFVSSHPPISKLIIRNSSFEGNSAKRGGAIFDHSHRFQIEVDSTGFNDNHATGGSGGAIQVGRSGQLIASNSSFTNNSAALDGGAISSEFDSVTPDNPTQVDLTNIAVTNNEAGRNGGGVYLYDLNTMLNIRGGYFESNRALDGDGGALLIRRFYDGMAMSIQESQFLDNSASSEGGAIAAFGVSTIATTQIVGNSARVGGGIFSHRDMTISDTSVNQNTAEIEGGGIYSVNHDLLTGERIQFVDNEAGLTGGAISTRVPTHLSYLLVADNSAGSNGGGIASKNALTFSHGAFAGNSAGGNGGALYTMGADAASYLSNMSMGNNQAVEGDSIYTDGLVRASYMSIGYDIGVNSSVYKVGSDQTIEFQYALVNGSAGNATSMNCKGAVEEITGSDSFDADGSCEFGIGRNVNNVDPMMENFAYNGGLSPTFGLLVGSPAIGMGDSCPGEDQRGYNRPASACDIGAYQFNAAVPTSVGLSEERVQSYSWKLMFILFSSVLLMTMIGTANYRR